MIITPPDIQNVPAPLVIGVSGHRDLRPQDLEKLQAKVRKILTELRKQYPSTPFILLSPLAEGADSLVARIALEPGIDAKLVVPIPMLIKLYEKDFQSSESLKIFYQLLQHKSLSFEIPMLSTEEEIAHQGKERNRQYEEVGKYIAHESQILIALWDGSLSEKVGGTAEVVQFQLQGIQEQMNSSLQAPELFPVYHIVTPRLSNPYPEGEPFQLIKKYPAAFLDEQAAESYYTQIFRNLDEFNNFILNGGDSLVRAATQSKAELLSNFDESTLTSAERLELDRYAVADALARLFQRKLLQMHRALHWLVFCAFSCLVLFAHCESHPIWLLASSLVVLGLSSLWQKHTSANKVDLKSQDYRAVAEGSRVRLFWHMAGISESVADNYLGKQRTVLDWIRNGLRGWGVAGGAQPTAPPTPEQMAMVQRLWVADQVRYFNHAVKKNEERLESTELLIWSCIWLAIMIALGLLVSILRLQFFRGTQLDIPHYEWIGWPLIVLDSLLGAAALLHHAGQQRAYAELIKQFRRMEAVFQKAQRVVDTSLQIPDIQRAQQCLRDLGKEALSENGDWVLLHRERPLEIPHP